MTVCISGGFDPPHSGHVKLIKEAAKHGSVIVILNSDEWLIRKKHYCLMPWKERAALLSEMRDVSAVVKVDDNDDTVCDALKRIKPQFFANGGDRTEKNGNILEDNLCRELRIKQLFGVGGDKVASSSNLVNAVVRKLSYEG